MSFPNTQTINPDNLGILSEMEEEGRMGEGWISLNDEEGEVAFHCTRVSG